MNINKIIDKKLDKIAIQLLNSENKNIIIDSLRIIGSIAYGNDLQVDLLIQNSNFLPNMKQCLNNKHNRIIVFAVWVISNISAGN